MLLKGSSDPKLFLIRTDVSVAQVLELWIMEAAVARVCCTATTLGAKHELKFKKKKSNSNSYKWCQFSLCIKYWSSKCNVSLNVASSNTYIYILWKHVLFSVNAIEPESINCVLGVLPLSELSWSRGLDQLELCNFPANLL